MKERKRGSFYETPCICTIIIGSSYSFRFRFFLCFVFHHGKNIVKVELFVPLLCVCAILPEKGHS